MTDPADLKSAALAFEREKNRAAALRVSILAGEQSFHSKINMEPKMTCEACDHSGLQADGETPCPCTERTFTKEDVDAAIAAAMVEASAAVPMAYAIYGADRTDAYARGYCGGVEQYRKAIRNLRPDAAAILRQRDARVYQEALEAAGRTDLPNPYGDTK